MGADRDSRSSPVKLAEKVQQGRDSDNVQPRSWLIEENDLWSQNQHSSQGKALLFAEAAFVNGPVGQMRVFACAKGRSYAP